jgi:hypothetical protein
MRSDHARLFSKRCESERMGSLDFAGILPRAAGDTLIGQEGAFGTQLLAHDVPADPPMFGADGILDVDASAMRAAPGWGLSVAIA